MDALAYNITSLGEMSKKFSQANSTIKYFKYYNWNDRTIKINLNMISGEAMLRVNTFHDFSFNESEIDYLPSSTANEKWNIQSV